MTVKYSLNYAGAWVMRIFLLLAIASMPAVLSGPAEPGNLSEAILALPPSFDSGRGSWTVTFQNESSQDITGFAADLICTNTAGVSSPRPITVDLAPALAWAVILRDSPDRDKVITFRPGERYSYSLPEPGLVSVRPAVTAVVFADDTAVGEDRRIQRVFAMRQALANRKQQVLNALQALSLSPVGPISLRATIEKLPTGSPVRREMERVEVHLSVDGEAGLADALSIYNAETEALRNHMNRRSK